MLSERRDRAKDRGFAGCAFENDLDGNVTRRNGNGQDVRLFWRAEGRLDPVNVVSGTRTSYQYDAMGRLARRSVNGSLDRLFLWQGDDLLAEVRYVSQNTVALVAEYSWYPGIDQPHAVRTPGNVVRYFGSDGVGSVSVLTEDSKPLVYFNYEPWGRALVRTMSGAEIPTDTVRPRWKGAFFEPVAGGLYYMRNRWYDPATGRFLSEDPHGRAGGANLYAFANGDPINWSDPGGTDMERPESDSSRTNGSYFCPAGGYHNILFSDGGICVTSNGESYQAGSERRSEVVVYAGFTACFVPFFSAVGACVTMGGYTTRAGKGTFVSYGLFTGLDVSAGVVVGFSTSMRAFRGPSVEGCGGLGGVVTVCRTQNDWGWGFSVSVGPTLTGGTARGGVSWTIASDPVQTPVCLAVPVYGYRCY